MRWLIGFLAARLMQAFAPIVAQRTAFAFDTSEWLADVEADHDVWECPEPGCDYTQPMQPLADWEQELLDATTMSDEQWAAHYRKLTGPGSPPGASVTPTAAVDTSATESGGGGQPQMRDELIEELVEEYRAKLYKWFR